MIGWNNIIKTESVENDLENAPADPSSLHPPDHQKRESRSHNQRKGGFCIKTWGYSGSQSGTLRLPFIAEAVEKVGVIENQATFDQSSLVFGYNDSR